MTISKDRLITNIIINGDRLNQAEEFKYLGKRITYNNDQAAEIDIRCRKASQIIGQISTLISSKEISLEVKRTIYNTIFISTLCYQCQTWTLDARTIRKITTTEMRCVRKMTGNCLRDRIRNENLRKLLGIEAAVNYLKTHQIKWFGHVI
jgi:hypothetical protein